MDTNETLKKLRTALNWLRYYGKTAEHDRIVQGANDAANYFQALDEWFTKGGFLPDAWEMARRPSPLRVHGGLEFEAAAFEVTADDRIQCTDCKQWAHVSAVLRDDPKHGKIKHSKRCDNDGAQPKRSGGA